MPCHILRNSMTGTFCGKKLEDFDKGDTYVEAMSRRVMEMPNCVECRREYLTEQLDRLPPST